MLWKRFAPATIFAVILATTGLTSAAQIAPRPGTLPGTRRGARPVRPEPCWQAAGISQAAMHQVRALRRQTRAEVESICMNSSLSAQQKHAEIRQIRARERQQIDALISPAQWESLRSCQASRGHGGGHPGFRGRGAGNPCGEMSRGKGHPMRAPEEDEDDLPPAEPPQKN